MKSLNAQAFKNALISGSYSIINNRGKIDALNVFPVPDGDTGSNMSGTVKSAVSDIENFDENHIGNLIKKFARGALLGARGNSGVILSQIFKGFSVALENKKEANTFDLVEAFRQAKQVAYNSVMKPVEGTILTVIRLVSEDLSSSITHSNDIETVFKKAVESARKACDLTPTMLPILKEVGVTDSGGEGLWYILNGMLLSLQGQAIKLQDSAKDQQNYNFVGSGFENESYDGEFGYCTEGVVELKKADKFDKDKFEYGLKKLGDSIVVVQDEEILKVHVHALKPGSALDYMQKFGEFIKIKSENMTLQANQSKGQKDTHQISQSHHKMPELTGNNDLNNEKSIAVISCNDGQGIIDEMTELGADIIIEGGQTNNPSTRDFLNAIKQMSAKNIIILPNNSNIMLVAQQVVQTVEDKNVIIVPTKSQVEGVTAMFHFDQNNSLEENQEFMEEAIESVGVGQVTKSIKDTKLNGVTVKKGDYLALVNRKVVASTKSKVKSAIKIVDSLISEYTEVVTIWYGENASIVDAQEVESYIKSNYNSNDDDIDVEIKHGNQHIYDFLISVV